jgi:hypothetical protein
MRIVLLAILLAGCESIPVGTAQCTEVYRQASADNYNGHSPVAALLSARGAGEDAFNRCESAK